MRRVLQYEKNALKNISLAYINIFDAKWHMLKLSTYFKYMLKFYYFCQPIKKERIPFVA